MTPLAYKFVALTAILAEINYCAHNLELKESVPIKLTDATRTLVERPIKPIEFLASIDTVDYSFTFFRSGRLRFITRLDAPSRESLGVPRGDISRTECLEEMSHLKSTISSNDAYRMATNWLVLMNVDVKRLETEQPHQIIQQVLDTNTVPLFYVKWGTNPIAAVDVMISGVTGELLHLRQEDDSYSNRPKSLLKDIDKLLAIPDDEFLKYSPTEKSNLLVQFMAVQYPPGFVDFPGISATNHTQPP